MTALELCHEIVGQENNIKGRLATLEQRMEELTKGMAALLARPPPANAPAPQTPTTTPITVRRKPTLHNDGFIPPIHNLDEEDEKDPEEVRPCARNVARQEESYRMEADLPTFNVVVDVEQFLDWMMKWSASTTSRMLSCKKR